ncbi:MAG: hypothetical protein HY749_06285 [Gammaproteobacteria bacterium]|nr:hypothetical protein [Gammaproteobacteria bacterium]MBI5618645.1 hypothetical protein [Gammaproteobacteria bacterium]
MDVPLRNARELVAEVEGLKTRGALDLSSDEDLTVALMNLVSIEEHLFFTGAKTGKTRYYDLLEEVREMRKDLLKQVVVDYEGEVWCISKHLLAASMRLIEVGTKQLSLGRKAEAEDLFEKAYALYSLFWGVNLGTRGEAAEAEVVPVAEATTAAPEPKQSLLAKVRELVTKAINCCIE